MLPGRSVTFSLPTNNKKIKTSLQIRRLMLHDEAYRYRPGLVDFSPGLGLVKKGCRKSVQGPRGPVFGVLNDSLSRQKIHPNPESITKQI